MTTDSEGGLSDTEEQLINLIRKSVRKEMKRAAVAVTTEPVIKRVKKGLTERMVERAVKREMRGIKQEMHEMKCLIQNLTQNTPADRNANPRTSHDRITGSEEAKFQLVFDSKLLGTIFTKDQIRDENGEYVKIKLIDTNSKKIVDAGDLSSMEIEIVVVKGDFGSEGNENWTKHDFNAGILNKRKDKGSLLVKGKQNIRLKNGVGTIDDLSFSRIGKYRLGARVLQRTSRGQMRIKEARSEAFRVRHQRGKRSHLDKIKEGGKFYEAFTNNDIHTEGDLKQMYKTNRDKLKEILKDCSNWEWDAIAAHASSVGDDANSNPLRSQEAEACPTIGPLLHEFRPVNEGMQNDRNRPSSSSPYADIDAFFAEAVLQNMPPNDLYNQPFGMQNRQQQSDFMG